MVILTKDQTKELEAQYVAAGNDHIKLMENAGNTISRFVYDKRGIAGVSIAVVCGHGNNGGDGFAAAKKFLENGAKVRILLADGEPVTDDAIDMFERAKRAGVKVIDCADPELSEDVKRYIVDAEIVIDAIYGLGFHGEMPESLLPILEHIAITEAEIISVDIPSGINADTGEVAKNAIRANYTVTFTSMKPAHVIYPAAEYCGTVLTAPIGIAESSINAVEKTITTVDYQDVRLCFRERKPNTYKGSYGNLLSICGSKGMAGAAHFSAKAAVQSGVGLANIVLPESIYHIVASQVPDPVYTVLPDNELGTLRAQDSDRIIELLGKSTACLAGCGMGNNEDTKAIVTRLIREREVPLILDADALNVISDNVYILKEAKAPVIITPHAGEMGRLARMEGAEVQKKRLPLATEFAQEFGVYVVLKGANTIIASPDGNVQVNLTGNPGMAKGGSGDILAGIVASLAAQGLSPMEACSCGVHIHGMAGDNAAARYSHHAMTPTDIINEFPTVFLDIER